MIFQLNKIFLLIRKVENKVRKYFGNHSKLLSSKKMLEINFEEKSNFKFIQIGANDGVSFDFLYEFVVCRESQGLVIEPIKEYYDELLKNYSEYPEIFAINIAVHPTIKKTYIYKIKPSVITNYPDWVKGIASLDSEHHKKTDIKSEDIIKEEVMADALMNIISDNKFIMEIDYLQSDTEGFDLEILRMIDFSIIKPKIIKFEYINLSDSDKITANELLRDNGYYLFNEYGDTVGVNLKAIKLF
ncbi:FkbM family methyltransferase [Flavobacterium sp. TAB 87]|uniref:FkbM family methyltransferase n=1 Tax=Flavobacterium sp. TAB 87 TaxID=1729581 RepID=UPI00076DE1EA|nr:FkbM family methyltransferase [Flavobacterium sp. TAB 87]KVV15876.1 methyltransferase, FkbM family [Flavobacterium sp. TAB 87]